MSEWPIFFKGLGDLTRLRLLNLLAEGEVCVCFLGEVLALAQPMVSRHLAYLKKAGLVTVRREGKWMYYGWATPGEPGQRSLLNGLRDWFLQDEVLTAEREELKRCVCR